MAELSGKEKRNKTNPHIFTLLVFPFLVHTKAHVQTGEQLKFIQAVGKSLAIGMGHSISQNYSTAFFPLSSMFLSQILSMLKKKKKTYLAINYRI